MRGMPPPGATSPDLQARGIQFQDWRAMAAPASGPGRGAQLGVPLRPDLFHLLDDAWRVGQRLERQAYQAMQVAERARRADQEAQAAQRRRGPRLKVTVPLGEAVAQEAQAISLRSVRLAAGRSTPGSGTAQCGAA